MPTPAAAPSLPRFDVERFLLLSRQIVAVGVREEARVYALVTGPQGGSKAALRSALASLLSQNPEQWRQLARCFDESFDHEPIRRPGRPLRTALERIAARLTPAARTALVMMVVLLLVGGAVYRLWPKQVPPPPPHTEEGTLPPPQESPTVRIVEDKPAGAIKDSKEQPVPLPKRDWILLCALSASLFALGLRWQLLPRSLRRWQMQSQRAAEAELAREARLRGQVLRPSYRVEPILPISRGTAEDCATLLGRLLDKERGVELDVPRTMDATVRAGGQFSAVLSPRQAAGEVLLLIDDEGVDYPWLSTVLALVELWRRQGVRIAAYTYSEEFPHHLDAHPRTHHNSIALAEVARQHAGAALFIVSRRLNVEKFVGESDWPQELAPFPQRAWLDPDPRAAEDFPKSRQKILTRLSEHGLHRYPLTDEGIAAAVRRIVSDRESASAGEPPWPAFTACRSAKEQRALRLWATAAALVPDATWDQVLALRAALPEISQIFPPPDVRPLQRLLEWVKKESGESPEKHADRLYLAPGFQDRLVDELRREDGGPTRRGSFEQRVHRILLGQLGDAPRAAEQQQGRGRLVWELKRATHEALLNPDRAQELLGRFIETGVESLLGAFLRGERVRQEKKALFTGGTWANLGALVAKEGRVGLRELLAGGMRLWLTTAGASLGLFALLSLPVLTQVPRVSERLQPKVTQKTEQETPAQSHVERVTPVTKPPDPTSEAKKDPVAPEKPAKVAATPQRPALVWVAPGSFSMGSAADDEDHQSDETRHPVKLSRGYYLMETEVTQGQYKGVTGEDPTKRNECQGVSVGSRLAAACMDWYEATKYANTLSGLEGLEKCYVISGNNVSWPKKQECRGYRLPTEAEWEYAARAGTSKKYAGGDSIDEVAWYSSNAENRVHPVKTKKANGWGLYDMSGNLWEWTWDFYTANPEKLSRQDPIGPSSGSDRVYRGGSWDSDAQSARVAYRLVVDPGNRSAYRGFRLARSYP